MTGFDIFMHLILECFGTSDMQIVICIRSNAQFITSLKLTELELQNWRFSNMAIGFKNASAPDDVSRVQFIERHNSCQSGGLNSRPSLSVYQT